MKNSLAFSRRGRRSLNDRTILPPLLLSYPEPVFGTRDLVARYRRNSRFWREATRFGLCAEGNAFLLALPRTESIKHRMCAEGTVLCVDDSRIDISERGQYRTTWKGPARRAKGSCNIDTTYYRIGRKSIHSPSQKPGYCRKLVHVSGYNTTACCLYDRIARIFLGAAWRSSRIMYDRSLMVAAFLHICIIACGIGNAWTWIVIYKEPKIKSESIKTFVKHRWI